MLRRSFGVLLLLVAAFLGGSASPTVSLAQEEGKPLIAYAARIAGDDARTRVVIDFDRKPEFSLHYTADPNRLIIDLPDTDFGFKPADLAATGLFGAIRYGRMGEGASRIVMTVKRPVRAVLAEVRENDQGAGFRLVLDCEVVTTEAFVELLNKQKWTGSEKIAGGKTDRLNTAPDVPAASGFVVAIDAGHGGIDAGAKGTVTEVDEKVITLEFAKILVERLNREKGISAFLVRDKDEFISLSERVVIARQRGAQLFVSLHADTLRQKDIRGATIYTISDKASDALAASLAERENLSDDIAGIKIEAESSEVTDILLDLTRRETQAFSIRMAETVLESFEGQIGLINNPLRHAGFRVLQAPDVPSVLLELGFLSNPRDEALLTDEAWRAKVADLLTTAVGRYMDSSGIARGG
ncbi:MAG: N-acetylmuramoyl-L-alanine amidase [Rhizobium sp.]|nr:N-acetylmuramoyl-L-alanine amidase [Rhizobium sp.]